MMRHTELTIVLLALLSFIGAKANGQTLAVTEHGDTIYVYNNGTWSFEILEDMPELYEMDFLDVPLVIDTIDASFTALAEAKKSVKNTRGQFSIKYDDKKWKRVPPATLNEEAEFAFQAKNTDVWCVVISEETSIPADKLFRIAKNTMEENTGGKMEIMKTELRMVNGHQVLRGVMAAELSGIDFVFDTYYYSNDLGSVQFTTWTSDKVWARNEELILGFLNGFIVQE